METNNNGFSVYRIKAADGTASAEIVPELGAIVSSLKLPWKQELREVLYQQPFFWDRETERTRGGLPFLFPVCGRMERNGINGAYLYNGRIYQIKIHGFSMRMPWVVDAEAPDSLTVSLRDTEATRAIYPFEFHVTLRFKMGSGGLNIEQEFKNKGGHPLPYYAGFHPYFLTPPAGAGKDATTVQLAGVSKWSYSASYADIVGRGAVPDFPVSVGNSTINEGLIEVEDPCEAIMHYPDGVALHMVAVGEGGRRMFPFVQLYTIADKPFFCMEPWMGFPNSMNSMGSVRWLPPDGLEKAVLKVWTA
jgi:galactose mutarotase-like enzyme